MKLTKEQLDQIIETVKENMDYDIETMGARDVDVYGFVPRSANERVKKEIENIINGDSDLKELFNLQRKLQAKIDFTNVSLTQYIRLMFIGIVTEVSEAIEETNWKPWKKDKHIDLDKLQEEVIDIWHFLINLTLASGMNSESVLKQFRSKNKINMKRQEEKY